MLHDICKRAIGLTVLFASVSCLAQAPQNPTDPAAQPAIDPAQAASMLLGPGDVVEVNVENSAQFNMKFRLDPNGDAELPYLGTEHFGGKTVEQVQRIIAAQLVAGQYFSEPQVSAFVQQYTNQTISVLGEVAKPGVFPGVGNHTLYQALSLAGGLTNNASLDVFIYRRDQPDPIKAPVSVNMNPNDPSAMLPVYSGDTIRVAKLGLVYVVGAVKAPNVFPIPTGRGITLLQAMTLAGGALRTAKRGSVHIIRADGPSKLDIEVSLSKITGGNEADMAIRADDIIYVPDSYIKIVAAGSAGVIGEAVYAATYLGK